MKSALINYPSCLRSFLSRTTLPLLILCIYFSVEQGLNRKVGQIKFLLIFRHRRFNNNSLLKGQTLYSAAYNALPFRQCMVGLSAVEEIYYSGRHLAVIKNTEPLA